MKKLFIIVLVFAISLASNGQQFIETGMIEFEVRTNNHKTFGDGIWAEMWKDKIPQFSTSWYKFTFHDNKGGL